MIIGRGLGHLVQRDARHQPQHGLVEEHGAGLVGGPLCPPVTDSQLVDSITAVCYYNVLVLAVSYVTTMITTIMLIIISGSITTVQTCFSRSWFTD